MTKTWQQNEDGVECTSYDNAYVFSVHTISVSSVALLVGFLETLKRIPYACVIRGQLKTNANPACTTRTSQDHLDKAATFTECPRRFLLLDFDGLPSAELPDPKVDADACVAAIRNRLPEPLREIAFFWSFSSSTGMKPGKLGIHIWLLLETPIGWRDAEAFMRACGSDVAVSRTVQIHYTAAPRFCPPLRDPLPKRFGCVDGIERVPTSVVTDLIEQGKVQAACSKATPRARQITEKSCAGPTITRPSKIDAQDPVSDGTVAHDDPSRISTGGRHNHLLSVGGFLRSKSFDEERLVAVLHAENISHCSPPLPNAEVMSIARSIASYPVESSDRVGANLAQVLSVIAGLFRHQCCSECLAACATLMLADAETADELVEYLLAKPDWEILAAEHHPHVVLHIPNNEMNSP